MKILKGGGREGGIGRQSKLHNPCHNCLNCYYAMVAYYFWTISMNFSRHHALNVILALRLRGREEHSNNSCE